MDRRLSVIIPGYNTPVGWWRRSVKSVLAALGPDDEVICVDDGSTVPLEPRQLECGDDSRVKWITLEKNCGQAEARNRGLEMAQGKYVTFVDSDDEVVPGIYAKCLETMEKTNSDLCVYGVKTVWENDGLYKINTLPDEECGVPPPVTIKKLYDSCLLEYVWNKVYRRDFLEKNNIRFAPDICPGEDTAFNLACLTARATVAIISTVGYVYYRMDGTTLSCSYGNLRQTLELRTHLWRKYKDENPGMRDVLGTTGEYAEKDILLSEWRNMWRRGSSITVKDRWSFLMSHPFLLGKPKIIWFLLTALRAFLRTNLYVRPIRRWHIKRTYPTVKEM